MPTSVQTCDASNREKENTTYSAVYYLSNKYATNNISDRSRDIAAFVKPGIHWRQRQAETRHPWHTTPRTKECFSVSARGGMLHPSDAN